MLRGSAMGTKEKAVMGEKVALPGTEAHSRMETVVRMVKEGKEYTAVVVVAIRKAAQIWAKEALITVRKAD